MEFLVYPLRLTQLYIPSARWMDGCPWAGLIKFSGVGRSIYILTLWPGLTSVVSLPPAAAGEHEGQGVVLVDLPFQALQLPPHLLLWPHLPEPMRVESTVIFIFDRKHFTVLCSVPVHTLYSLITGIKGFLRTKRVCFLREACRFANLSSSVLSI